MMSTTIDILSAVHFLALAGLSGYGLHRLWLVRCWRREREKGCAGESLPTGAGRYQPVITIQLPLFNEPFVAARIIDAAAAQDWPHDRLEIQLLDDSNDETRQITQERCAWWRNRGIDISLLHRDERHGYKAGALAAGLRRARGELIAIFDADFIPGPDFLKQTVPWLEDQAVGMVQARWDFLNAEHSWLTGLQALLLGPHFGIEHFVRFRRGLFFNFNGTAGIWRRRAIEDGGGWRHDTVTEDLDLSYRAQLKGWRFIYLDHVGVPSELPTTLAGFRSQQQRWAKGSLQTARKILPTLLRAPLPLPVKLEGMAHLLANLGWIMAAIATLTLLPAVIWRNGFSLELLLLDTILFFGSTAAILYYLSSYASHRHQGKFSHFLPLLPLLSLGMAPTLAWSALMGLFQGGGVFERTPKYGLKNRERLRRLPLMQRQRSFRLLLVNLLFCALSFLPLLHIIEFRQWLAGPFLLLFPLGFVLVIFQDCQEISRARDREGSNG